MQSPVVMRARSSETPPQEAARKPKLLDQVRQAIRARHYSKRTEQTYADWIKRFILFHGKRHPSEMGEPEINQFLTDLAINKRVSASTQNQALSALLFLYQHVLKKPLEWIDPAVRAKKPKHLPVVLTKEEVKAIIQLMEGGPRLVATLLYGAGLRLNECLELRFKDIDFTKDQILVRDGKGQKDRITTLPTSVKKLLLAHLRDVYRLHRKDLREGFGRVVLPMHWPESILTRTGSGDGNGHSRRRLVTLIKKQGSNAGIIFMRLSCRRR